MVATLKDLYTEEMRDLWSANNQMQNIVTTMADKASDPKLQGLLKRSVDGIAQHTLALRDMVDAQADTRSPAMEGLVTEAKRQALETDMPNQLRDLAIIANYQRMSHYGLAGFGTAAAYASALGMNDEASKLRSIVSNIYKADEYSSYLAESVEKAVG